MGDRTASQSPTRIYSSGRGGAGNIQARRPSGSPEDLVTPNIKQDIYTTGRGGTGNMAKMDNVDNARKAQDVEAPVHRDPENAFHYGRGGAANVGKLSEEERRRAQEENSKRLAKKGKDLLDKIGLGSKK